MSHPSPQHPAQGGAGSGAPPTGLSPMPMMPMMMPGGMTPQMMQQQMAIMQQQMHAMMSGQFAGAGAPMPMPMMAGFPMMPGMMPGMFGMPTMAPMPMGHMQQAAPAASPMASPPVQMQPTPAPHAPVAPAQRAAPAHTVAPLPAMPMVSAVPPMPLMGFGMSSMPAMMGAHVDPNWAPVVSKATPVVAAAAPTPVAAPKADVFGDLSNPDLALRKERFVIEQPKKKHSAPPPSAGVRAEDEEEEEFADFASGEQHQADDFSFGPSPPVASASPHQQQPAATPAHSSASDLSFDAEPSASAPAVDAAPLPQQDMSADALMSKAFDMFEHKTNAPLVAHASMSQIASHTPHKAAAAHPAATGAHKGHRDMPQDLDDLLSNLVGSDASAPRVELPSLGAERPKPAPAPAAAALVEEDDEEFADFATAAPTGMAPTAAGVEDAESDEDFADFNSAPAAAAPITPAAAPAPTASPVAVQDEDDDDGGFGDFGSAAAQAAPAVLPQTTSFSSYSPPTSSFGAGGAVPTSSFGVPTSSFGAPSSSFAPPSSSFTHQPQLSSYTSPPPAFSSAPAFVPPAAYQPPHQVGQEETQGQEEEEEEEFADFSSAPNATAEAVPAAVAAPPSFDVQADPFGALGAETSDGALASLEAVAPPTADAAPATAATIEDDDAAEEDEEDFADFSSAPAAPVASDPSVFDVSAAAPIDPAIAAAEAEVAAAVAAAAEAALHPPEPKKEEDLIGDWGTTTTVKKSNPFAMATPAVEAPTITAAESTPAVAAPSFDDVFGSLVETEEVAAPVLPDLLLGAPLSTTSAAGKGRGSITTAQAIASSYRASSSGHLAAPSSARPATSDADEASGAEDDFGGFASSASDGAKAHNFGASSSFDSLATESSPPNLQASPSPAPFQLSDEAKSIALPSEVQVASKVPRGMKILPRQVDESGLAPTEIESAIAMLLRQERFAEATAAQATRGSASQLTELQAKYKAALAAAEEDESEDGAQLAAAMQLQKQIKKLKALKPDEKWLRSLTAQEQASGPATHDQLKRTLVTIDPAWEAAFTDMYPESFATVAERGALDDAVRMQTEANLFVQDILGPSSSEREAHGQRLEKIVQYVKDQLAKGQSFVQEASHLDLADASKQAEFAALLSAPASSTHIFLSGLASLYRILLLVEFSNALFDLQVSGEPIAAAHRSWWTIMQHAHSAPLKAFLGEWLAANAIDVDAQRQTMAADNSVDRLAARRGRHSCAVTLANQAQGMKHPACAALQSHLQLQQ